MCVHTVDCMYIFSWCHAWLPLHVVLTVSVEDMSWQGGVREWHKNPPIPWLGSNSANMRFNIYRYRNCSCWGISLQDRWWRQEFFQTAGLVLVGLMVQGEAHSPSAARVQGKTTLRRHFFSGATCAQCRRDPGCCVIAVRFLG